MRNMKSYDTSKNKSIFDKNKCLFIVNVTFDQNTSRRRSDETLANMNAYFNDGHDNKDAIFIITSSTGEYNKTDIKLLYSPFKNYAIDLESSLEKTLGEIIDVTNHKIDSLPMSVDAKQELRAAIRQVNIESILNQG